jgi:hypothetical protein
MTEQWAWAPYKRVKEAAEELKGLIRAKYPDAEFVLVRSADDRRSWNLWTMVNVEDPDEVGDLVIDREIDMLVEEHIPIHVIPTRSSARFAGQIPASVRRTG